MKRLISLLIALALILPALPPALASGTVPGTPPIPSVGDVWDGSAEQPVSLVERNGVYYYEITRCAQLAFIAQNGGDWLGYNYILGADLIFNDVVLTWDEDGKLLTDPAALLPWTTIDGFKGDLLGNGHTVSGLYCSISGGYAGLFGSLYGSVSGLAIVNSFIRGARDSGGLAGSAGGIGKSISGCSFSGAAVSSGSYAGGLIGSASCQYLSNLVNYGTVSGAKATGGIAGSHSGYDVSNCTNYGTVHSRTDYAGGITGH